MNVDGLSLVMIPEQEWQRVKSIQEEILREIRELQTKGPTGVPLRHITAKEFMDAVRIKRSKFDQLVQANKVRIVRKGRKLYVPVGEVERYFGEGG